MLSIVSEAGLEDETRRDLLSILTSFHISAFVRDVLESETADELVKLSDCAIHQFQAVRLKYQQAYQSCVSRHYRARG